MPTIHTPAAGYLDSQPTPTDTMQRLRIRTTIAASTLILAAYASAQSATSLSPFTTDGCSMFPDRSPVSASDWCTCCVAHDVAYWRGGTAEERLAADQQLRACVLKSTGNADLAEFMFTGVRVGGDPQFNTSYRWAYGWPFGRGYQALSPVEQEEASSLYAQYTTSNPPQMCSK